MCLTDKIVMVTGAGRGIGKAIALRIAKDHAKLVLNDIKRELLEEVADQVKEIGSKAITVSGDISDQRQVAEMISNIKERWGGVSVLVNNAGVDHRSSLTEHSEKWWNRVMDVNLKGPFLMCREVVPYMIQENWGRIINLASMAYKGMGKQVAYDASKAGLIGLTKSLAVDLARYNITVNAVCPSWVNTDMIKMGDLVSLRDKIINRIPMRRLAEPEEIAGVVWFLAQDEASYMSGQNINIDGAWMR